MVYMASLCQQGPIRLSDMTVVPHFVNQLLSQYKARLELNNQIK